MCNIYNLFGYFMFLFDQKDDIIDIIKKNSVPNDDSCR